MLGLALSLALSAASAPPTTIAVQGSLRNLGNLPVDGQYGLTVRLFDDPSSGTMLLEKVFVAVPVTNGLFDLVLDGLTPAVLTGPLDRYVELQVEADPPLPRTRLLAVPYAITARVALDVSCSGCVEADDLAPGVLSAVATSGSYLDLLDTPDLTHFGRVDTPNTWAGVQTFGADPDFALQQAQRFRFQAVAGEPAPCSAATVGLAYFDTGKSQLYVCDGTAFVSFSRVGQLGTPNNPGKSCRDIQAGGGSVGSGPYWIRPAAKTYQVHCDMLTAGGGWTMLLNLDTSDGHVMWWANALWTNGVTRGDPVNAFVGDQKSDAWNDYTTATKILVLVHQNGVPVGWRVFQKSGTLSMAQYLSGGDNTLLGSGSLAASTADVWAGERLVRLSTALYANHCVQTGGTCTSGTAGSPDGDRIGSHEAAPSDNNGGGLGNWHDIHYCCAGSTYAGMVCNGGAIRTASEAQAGWSGAGQSGTFGTDSAAPMTGTQSNAPCGNANWAIANGISYDYAVFFGE